MPPNVEDWEHIAAWWDAKQGDDGDPWHRMLIDPVVFRLLGPVSGQAVLDLACGNGYIARRLARQGAKVTGVDASAPIIARARQRGEQAGISITYYVGDAAHLDMLADETFDIAVCNMGLMDIADGEGAIHEVARVLKPSGRCVASICHPCFDTGNASGWAVERMGLTTTVWRKVSRYREVRQDWCWRRTAPDTIWQTKLYHRPLSWYFRAFRAAGLALVALEEPEATEEFIQAEGPQGSWIAEIPLHCVFEARKILSTFD